MRSEKYLFVFSVYKLLTGIFGNWQYLLVLQLSHDIDDSPSIFNLVCLVEHGWESTLVNSNRAARSGLNRKGSSIQSLFRVCFQC